MSQLLSTNRELFDYDRTWTPATGKGPGQWGHPPFSIVEGSDPDGRIRRLMESYLEERGHESANPPKETL